MARTSPLVVLVTGASSGFGKMIATDLAVAGHVSYATMKDTKHSADAVAELEARAEHDGLALHALDLDVQSDASAQRAVDAIVARHGRIDVLVHNAGHMVYGPSEAFAPEQLAELYDINVLGTQRVNRAALPHMRAAKSGLLVWISSSSVAGGVPPLLGPYFAAKAGMDALAVCYGKELAPLGIETSIVVPGAFTTGTNHFANAGSPSDTTRHDAYAAAYPPDFAKHVEEALAATSPPDADPAAVGRAVVAIVDSPRGSRAYRVVIDPAGDGASVTMPVIDRVRDQFLDRIGFPQLKLPEHPTTA